MSDISTSGDVKHEKKSLHFVSGDFIFYVYLFITLQVVIGDWHEEEKRFNKTEN